MARTGRAGGALVAAALRKPGTDSLMRPSRSPTVDCYIDFEIPMNLTAVFEKVPEGYIGFVEELPGANAQGRTRAL